MVPDFGLAPSAPIRDLKPGEEIGRDRLHVRSPEGETDALDYRLFPNTMLNLYPDNMQTNVILPLGPDRTDRTGAHDLRVARRGARDPGGMGSTTFSRSWPSSSRRCEPAIARQRMGAPR